MKRAITFILMLTLVSSLLLAVPVFAEVSDIDEIYEDIDHPWENGNSYVEQAPDGAEIVYVINGSVDVILERGIAVTISNFSEGVASVMIYPFDSNDSIAAWNWVMDALGNEHKSVIPIDIVLLDEEGKALENAHANIELTIPASFEKPVLYEVDTDGEINESFLPVIYDGVARFRASNSYYYVLAEEGNNLPIIIAVVVLLVVVAAVVTVLVVRTVKKKRREEPVSASGK